jgi:glycosyltransferase involved in cell wall biosynthesis
VIPVKNSGSTIRQCVESILTQDYSNFEIIVVGDGGDTSWPALASISDERLIRIPVEISMNGATRDANLKRSIGLTVASGDVIAMTDSDMSLRPGWLTNGVALTRRYDAAASSMVSTATGFLSQYIDSNRVGSRTPRYRDTYVLNAENFGSRGFKPPVTANLFMRRRVYDVTEGPNPAFTRSYEDYEWARRIVDAGFSIFSTDELAGDHSHRARVREALKDYRRSGRGCADYIITHPHCELAKARARQCAGIATTLPLGLAIGFFGGAPVRIAAIATFAAAATAAVGLSWYRTRTWAALMYPLITLLLGLAFWAGLSGQLARNRPRVTLRRASLPAPAGVILSEILPKFGISVAAASQRSTQVTADNMPVPDDVAFAD